MHPLVIALKEDFEQHTDPVKAGPMAAYMRNQFAYLGIKVPEMTALQKAFYARHSPPPLTELDGVLRDLWFLPEREYQYAALGLLSRFEKKLPPEFIDTIEYLLVTKSWWDTVDGIAGNTVGPLFRRFPAVQAARLPVWRASPSFWLRRTAILFQLHYKRATDFPLLCEVITENLGSKEFFINKAIGWALREYAKTDPAAVREFVERTPLEPLSRREALKHLGVGA